MSIEEFNKLAKEQRICTCPHCNHTMKTQSIDQKFDSGEKVRCPACFVVFEPFLNKC